MYTFKISGVPSPEQVMYNYTIDRENLWFSK